MLCDTYQPEPCEGGIVFHLNGLFTITCKAFILKFFFSENWGNEHQFSEQILFQNKTLQIL